MDLPRRRQLALSLFAREEWQIVVDILDNMEVNAVDSMRANPRDERPAYEIYTLELFRGLITQLAENAGFNGNPFRKHAAAARIDPEPRGSSGV